MRTQDKFAVVADTAIGVRVSVHSDKRLTTQLGSEETSLLFSSAERDEFIRANAAGRQVLITGWAEMGHPATGIAGTQAAREGTDIITRKTTEDTTAQQP